MLKSNLGKTSFNLAASSRNPFEGQVSANRRLTSQAYEKLKFVQSSKMTLLQVNKEKIKKRNSELMKLFKQNKPEYMNIDILEKSEFMRTNELFYYLVNCLKKERQGMISVDTISEQKAKSPKPIETKIRQFLYNSLQESLLMSQKQVEESRYFERLFNWFTDVFKEREMKLSFKKESNLKKDPQNHDEEWIIRNTFKSSMPEEVGQYHRKMLNIHQLNQFDQKFSLKSLRKQIEDQENNKENTQDEKAGVENFYTNNGVQRKLFIQTVGQSIGKSSQLLPILNRKGFNSALSQHRQEKELEELRAYDLQWKKSRAHFEQHLAKRHFSSKIKLQPKFGQNSFHNTTSSKKGKQNSSSFSLEPKVMDKIQAAKLGVTLTQFRKNKENILQEKKNVCHDSPVFHPYLTSNYFYDIKKKKLDNLRKKSPTQFRFNFKNTEDSDEMNSSRFENTLQQNDVFEDTFNPAIPVQSDDEIVQNIDGLGLTNNPLEKNTSKAKKSQVQK